LREKTNQQHHNKPNTQITQNLAPKNQQKTMQSPTALGIIQPFKI